MTPSDLDRHIIAAEHQPCWHCGVFTLYVEVNFEVPLHPGPCTLAKDREYQAELATDPGDSMRLTTQIDDDGDGLAITVRGLSTLSPRRAGERVGRAVMDAAGVLAAAREHAADAGGGDA